MIIVDTNVWSETMRPEPDTAVVTWVRRHHPELFLTSITVHEMQFGVLQLPASRRKDHFDKAVAQLLERLASRIVSYDTAAATAHAELRAAAKRSGRALGYEDGQILGIAASRGATIATRNVRDFVGHGVPVIDPWSGLAH